MSFRNYVHPLCIVLPLFLYSDNADAQRTLYVNPPQTFESTCPEIELDGMEHLLAPGQRYKLEAYWNVDHRGFTSDIRVRGNATREVRRTIREAIQDMRCETTAHGSMSYKDSHGRELTIEHVAAASTTSAEPEYAGATQTNPDRQSRVSGFNTEFDEAVAAYDEGDYVQAAKTWKRLAEDGSGASAYNYAELLLSGKGVSKDYEGSLKWFIRAAELEEDGAYERAAEVASELAETGSPFALNALGNFYYYGDGVERDYRKSFELYREAADADYISAIVNLARMYDLGQGIARDYSVSTQLYLRAARRGDAESIFNLGVSYAEGMGVPKDMVRAYALFNHAASMGDEKASDIRDDLESEMPMPEVMEAQNLTRAIYNGDWSNYDGEAGP